MIIYLAMPTAFDKPIKGFTSLLGACEYLGVSYYSATKGRRAWVKNNTSCLITEVELVKIKGRGRKMK